MGPKKAAKVTDKTNRTLEKEKKKVVEDKTFGLKNKNKSTKVQAKIASVTHNIMTGGTQKGGMQAEVQKKLDEKAAKKKEDDRKFLMASLFAGVVSIKKTNEEGEVVDPATILCPMFKAGVCAKGRKCKNSHDMSMEQSKQAGYDVYHDPRAKKGGMPDTIITCKDFLQAVQKGLIGFNWVCPNGGDKCPYRHMLPQGYVLDAGPDEAKDDRPLEEIIEEERSQLKSDGLTPVTAVSFAAWKERREKRKQDELEAKMAEEAKKAKGGKKNAGSGIMSGKALFTYDPTLFKDDDDAVDDDLYDEASEEENPNLQQEESKTEQTEAEVINEELFEEDPEDIQFD